MPVRSGELVAELGHTKDERDCGDCKTSSSWGWIPQVSLRRVAQPDPVALIGPRPGPADIRDATWGLFAARLPARRAAA